MYSVRSPLVIQNPAFSYPGQNLKIFLPASSAGTPSISPAYDPFWSDTSAAIRVVSRLNKNYGTANDDVSFTATANKVRVLLRQYVCPLTHSALYMDKRIYDFNGGVACGFPSLNVSCRMKVSSGSSFFTPIPWWVVRLVDPSGATIRPIRTLGSVTMPAFGLTTMTSSGGFSASDVGKGFVVDQHDNHVIIGGSIDTSIPNSITAFGSSSSVTIALPYPGAKPGMDASDTPGSGRTIRFLEGGFSSIGAFQLSPVLTTSFQVETCGGGGSLGYTDRGSPRLSLVLETGFIVIGETSTSQTVTFRFGDSSSDTLIDDPSGGSAGGYFTFISTPALLSR